MSKFSQKRVAIVGAGVSGLATAVSMLKAGIQPTIFDRTSGIGGMWNDGEKPYWTSMRTNISKFTTVLSDLAWPSDAQLFPTQHEVFLYLTAYADQFLSSDVFLFNTEVTDISYTDDSNKHWTVQYRTSINETKSVQFDFVVVTSGFFESPHFPQNIVDLKLFPGEILHSSQYRSSEVVQGKRVVLVGASMSAAEIAADMATTAQHIVHVAPHNFWSIPRFLPTAPKNPASPFLPVDFVFYRRSTRTSTGEILFRGPDDYRKLNEYFRVLTGGDQHSSRVCDVNDETPPFVAISDMYAEWTRAGHITLQHGRLN
jgi:cation diffusion facilitator CzcD-associated flavoprotein CzcO